MMFWQIGQNIAPEYIFVFLTKKVDNAQNDLDKATCGNWRV
jgi:hypothetical protein